MSTRDADGNLHLTRREFAATIIVWLQSRGGSFTLEGEAVCCDVTGVDLSPLSDDEMQDICVGLARELRALLRTPGTVH